MAQMTSMKGVKTPYTKSIGKRPQTSRSGSSYSSGRGSRRGGRG